MLTKYESFLIGHFSVQVAIGRGQISGVRRPGVCRPVAPVCVLTHRNTVSPWCVSSHTGTPALFG